MPETIKKKRKPAGGKVVDGCWWEYDEDGAWETGCGRSWIFIDGGPEDNTVRFCPGCGKRVVVNSTKGEDRE